MFKVKRECKRGFYRCIKLFKRSKLNPWVESVECNLTLTSLVLLVPIVMLRVQLGQLDQRERMPLSFLTERTRARKRMFLRIVSGHLAGHSSSDDFMEKNDIL